MQWLIILPITIILAIIAVNFIRLYLYHTALYDKADDARLLSICGLVVAIIIFILLSVAWHKLSKGSDNSEADNTVEIFQDMENMTSESAEIESLAEETKESVETVSNSENTTEYSELITYDVEQYLKTDIQNMKNGNKKTIERWFGVSKIFTPENLQAALSGVEISKAKNNKIHVCVFNEEKIEELRKKYLEEERKMNVNINEDSIEAYIDIRIKKEVEDKSIYDCYELDVTVTSGNVDVTEELKEVITNGWYKGIGVDRSKYKVKHDSLLEDTSSESEKESDSEEGTGSDERNDTIEKDETEFDIDNYRIDWDSLKKVE